MTNIAAVLLALADRLAEADQGGAYPTALTAEAVGILVAAAWEIDNRKP